MTKDEIIKYWLDSSEVDFKALESLFNDGHYAWALFVGHLVLEKLLKACYVKNVDSKYPQIHHLLKIAESANLDYQRSRKFFYWKLLHSIWRQDIRTIRKDFTKEQLVSLANITSVKLRSLGNGSSER